MDIIPDELQMDRECRLGCYIGRRFEALATRARTSCGCLPPPAAGSQNGFGSVIQAELVGSVCIHRYCYSPFQPAIPPPASLPICCVDCSRRTQTVIRGVLALSQTCSTGRVRRGNIAITGPASPRSYLTFPFSLSFAIVCSLLLSQGGIKILVVSEVDGILAPGVAQPPGVSTPVPPASHPAAFLSKTPPASAAMAGAHADATTTTSATPTTATTTTAVPTSAAITTTAAAANTTTTTAVASQVAAPVPSLDDYVELKTSRRGEQKSGEINFQRFVGSERRLL